MRVIKHSEIDFEKWDRAVLNSELPLVFAQSFYLNATCSGWSALVDGDYRTVMPLTVNKKLGISYLFQPPFTPQLGIYGRNIEKITEEFFEFIKTEYKYIDIEVNAANKVEGKDKRTFVIDFENQTTYNSNTKRNIAKAEKSLINISVLSHEDSLHLSKKHLNPFLKNKLRLPLTHIRLFEKLLSSALKNNHLKTFIAKNNNSDILALAHFISNKKHAVYLKGTSFDRNSGSMHLLMHHAIEFYRSNKVKWFDFGGGQSDTMAQFYSGFGAQPLIYKTFKFNKLPLPLRWMKK
jgi:hypothetical protein